jgi:hypothetical protein
VYGVYYGFDVGGEHLLLTHCMAIRCNTGYRFYGTPETMGGHPLTAINCSQEVCLTGPVFAGGSDVGHPVPGIELIGWNEEVVTDPASEWRQSMRATEASPGLMRGRVTYQISDGAGGYLSTNRIPFWQPRHGAQCHTENLTAIRSGGLTYQGMNDGGSPSGYIRASGANPGQTAWATNNSMHRYGFTSGYGMGVPVFWDGATWRDYQNNDAMYGPNLLPLESGSDVKGYSWTVSNNPYPGELDVKIPKGEYVNDAVVLTAPAALKKGIEYAFEIKGRLPDGCYAELLFASGAASYQTYSGLPIRFTSNVDTTCALRINITLSTPGAIQAVAFPSLREHLKPDVLTL